MNFLLVNNITSNFQIGMNIINNKGFLCIL
uniref:Uncharacterized protein n=1 Tax=Myoviridae sp. ctCo31 TaxID=2825053 RepID=A0A8S5UM12_9CAUD|nr:MAG TPA: hypothetical protein [Myoviridae sp. ctCo31]